MEQYFKPNTRMWKVAHCKEFKPFAKYLINPRKYAKVMQIYKIKHLKWFYPFDASIISAALNSMYERCHSGQNIFHYFGNDVALFSFCIGKNRPFVLILPGGGYGDVCSFSEGFPLAIHLNDLGYNAFVGQYSVGQNAHYPNPQNDVAKMIKFIIDNADKNNIDANEYAVCGFSAGGHLAASWGTKTVGYAKYSLPKPSALFLSYPVITMGKYTHVGSHKNLLGKDCKNMELQKLYSIELQVDKDYPATFIWQCKNDKVVPFRNSLLLREALNRNRIANRFMPVEGTAHGWGIATKTPAEGWIEKALAFWEEQ